jgi:GH15 family glucan-1,4-alpha-glucosidase
VGVLVTSAAAPSPFPPIADYAFLSDYHTGALVARDGSIDWLCVPRFDASSVFASLLDREAGTFRVGPYGMTAPVARSYEPGSNVVVTTWKGLQGWLEVREALTVGPATGEDTVTPHARPPADNDADHMIVRTITCLEGEVEVELVCVPAFDYGRTAAEWALVDGRRGVADASGAGQTIRLYTDLQLGIEANQARARHTLRAGERAYAALSWDEGLRGPSDIDEATARLDATLHFGASGWDEPDHLPTTGGARRSSARR